MRDQHTRQYQFQGNPENAASGGTKRRNLRFEHLHHCKRHQHRYLVRIACWAGGDESGEERNPDEILNSDKALEWANGHRLLSLTGLCHNVKYSLMPNPIALDQDRISRPDSQTPNDPEAPTPAPSEESFGDILTQYEQAHSHKPDTREKGLEGTVVAVTADSVFIDIGYKIEGIVPLAEFVNAGETVKPGDKLPVSIKGRGPEGYYELSRIKVERPKDWSALEKVFGDKAAIAGTVTAVIKGGLSVDVGVRAFMPASRSGAKDAAEMEKLVGQEIRCRIIKLDVADEDVVVDRRARARRRRARGQGQALFRESRKARPFTAPFAA